MAVLDDVGGALTNAGLVDGSSGWKLYLGHLQDEPGQDQAVCVYELAGDMPEVQWAVDRPSIQVRVRGAKNGYQAARDKLQAVFDLLQNGEASLGGAWVFIHAVQSGPTPLGQDEKNRPHLAQRFTAMRNRAA